MAYATLPCDEADGSAAKQLIQIAGPKNIQHNDADDSRGDYSDKEIEH